jgi:hypothetical protein
MPGEIPIHDVQNLWQLQPTEAWRVSANQLRQKAQQHNKKACSAVLVSTLVATVLFVCFGWGFLMFPAGFQSFHLGPIGAWSVRLGFGLLSLWSLYSGYRTYKALWPSAAVPDAELKTTLQSYRQELEKRRDYAQNIWLRSGLIFSFLGMAMIVMPMVIQEITRPLRMLANVGPILALFMLWLAMFLSQRKRRRRKLQQEIDQLRAFENEYQLEF